MDYPNCRGTRDYEVAEPHGVGADGEGVGPRPDCPRGHGPMVLKLARRGRNAGRAFWSCSIYPTCNETVDAEEGMAAHADARRPSASSRRSVQWVDRTLDRHGWTCRYTTAGASLRALVGSIELGAEVSQAWIARSEGTAFPPEPVLRVVGLCRKILQRGSAPPLDPFAEQALLERIGLGDELESAPLPGDLSKRLRNPPRIDALAGVIGSGAAELRLDPGLELDSEEERLALEALVAEAGPEVARWLVPQPSLEALIGSAEPFGRRVDLLVAAPWSDPFVLEIDGSQHASSTAVDDDRDDALRAAGLPVHRVPADAVRNRERLWLDEVRARLPRRQPQRDSRASDLVYGPAQVHRFALAVLEALGAGHLSGTRWVIDVRDDLDLLGDDLVSPYFGLIAAVDSLWAGTVAPDEVVLGVNGRWRLLRRQGITFEAVGTASPEPAMVVIHLEAGRSAIEELPALGEVPAVVVRSAFLPARIADPVYEGSRRAVVQTEGEEIEKALVFLLRSIFAKEDFREGQLDALLEVVEGRDCVVLLPTGAGKSLIYQLAGLCLPGRTLIVDPLVSLMEDQVEGLAVHGVDRVALISSYLVRQGLRARILDEISSGEALFVFVSPERLQQPEFRSTLRALAQTSPINIAVVDEAHCVSEWGHDFRTAYLNVARVLREVCRDADGVPPPLLALTGTASRAVLRDVLIELGIERNSERAVVRPRSFDRPELRYTVQRVDPSEAAAALVGYLRSLPSKFGVPATDFFRARGDRTFSGLVFCPNVNGRAGVVEVSEALRGVLGVPPPIYSGSTAPKGMDSGDWESAKRRNANAFKRNEAPLLVSTKAFGMGIDKPNIRYVVHFGIPGSIEGYYQEVGRGGRDRQRAECGLFLVEYDERRARELLDDEADLEKARADHEAITWAEADDISGQLYFHLRAFSGVDEEAAVLDDVLEELGEISRRRTVEIPMGDDDDARERALHRLVVLGVVQDYLVEWGSKKFVVEVRGVGSDDVVDSLLRYVGRNQPGRVETIAAHAAPCRLMDASEAAEGCGRILIEFVYDTVERSRRRSLREMWLAARESGGDANVTFRQRILDYLSEGDISPTLERLVDAPRFRYSEWQEELSKLLGTDEARELRGNTARLLSSYPDHPGMLLARGFSELADDRGNLSELVSSLETSVASSVARYASTESELEELFSWLLEEADRRRRPAARTAVVSVALRFDALVPIGTRELERALDAPDRAEPGLLVLALADALDRTASHVEALLSETEGVLG
ncbi:MAG TPA: RecQ family ATP-dependent DNA helicase [Gaiellaceae bacterium]|nr:RecQ family ATP-dependent DNA helicase [Gaiellaceae bacterium]